MSSHAHSHWGFHAASDDKGGYPLNQPVLQNNVPVAIVLTEAGELLINRSASTTGVAVCRVALVLEKGRGILSRPQAQRMHRVWDMAVALANGEIENIQIDPLPHSWRFARTDYLTLDEWQAQHPPGDKAARAEAAPRTQNWQ